MKCSKCGFENQAEAVFCAKCATKLLSVTRTLETAPEGLGKGEIFAGRFELIEELGAGGMGIVYRAYDKKVGEEIALKILHPEIALEETTVDRFRNEIKLARRISHRNVCRMHELHEEGKTLFITMEYVSGQDLKGLIKKSGALATGKALSIAKQVAEGLCEAHNLGVIHRDLKPQNIMVDKEGTAKIMDFGIARSLRTAGMTAEGMIIGTPEYMAPEQVEGVEADQRTDIYAFGAILFEMATGRVPFEGDSPLSVAYKHKNEIPLPPRKLNAEIPEPFNKLILRCLEKEKENRYQTAEDVLADLIRIEEGLPISERVALPSRPTIRISREKPTGINRFLIPALAVIVLALAAIITLRVLPKKPPISPASASAKPSLAVLYFENLSGDPSLDHLKEGLATLLNINLSQSKLIWVLDPSGLNGVLKKLKLEGAAKYTREDLIKVADEGGAGYTTTGSLMKAGESIVIMLTLQKPQTAEVVESFKLTCQNIDEIYPKTDELVAKIKSAMDLTPAQLAADGGQGIGKLTRSPEAMKYYLESSKYYYRLDYAKVISLCEKAIELDPNFALPYLYLAVAYYSGQGNLAKSNEARNKAYELRDRVPERERYLVEANFYENQGENWRAKAIEAYEKYLQFAPRDSNSLQSLGSLYGGSGDDAKYLEYRERSYQVKPSPQSMIGVLLACQRLGQLERAEDALKGYYKSHEDNHIIQYYSCYLYIVRKDFDQALAEIERGFLQEPSPDGWSWDALKADVSLACGELAEAEKAYLAIIQKAEKPAYVHAAKISLFGLDILKGRTNRAAADFAKALGPGGFAEGAANVSIINTFLRLRKYDEALEVNETILKRSRERGDPGRIREGLWWKGIGLVEKKAIPEAEQIAEELKSWCQKSPYRNAFQTVEHLQGLIDLEKGAYDKAIGNLTKASARLRSEFFYPGSLPTHALHFYPLAIAYYRSGNFGKAKAEFEKLTNLTAGRWDFGDLYAKSFYWLGKIAEEQKDKRRAAENYGKFLDLWKDADPGLPEVDDAKARLAAMR